MINEGHPAGLELAEIVKWGNPWHGLLDGGTLHCAGAVDITHDAAGGGASGSTYLIRIPSLPAPETTAEETAQGQTWTNWAILSGANNALSMGGHWLSPAVLTPHGTSQAWLYIDPAGAAWELALAVDGGVFSAGVYVATGVDADALHQITVYARRFGLIGFGDNSVIAADSLANVDFSQPAPLDIYPSGGELYYLQMEDIRSNGDRLILAVLSPLVSPFETLYRHPMGFLEMQFSGTPGVDFAASLTVLHTPSTCAGTASAGLISGRVMGMWYDSSGSPDEVLLDVGETEVGRAYRLRAGGNSLTLTAQSPDGFYTTQAAAGDGCLHKLSTFTPAQSDALIGWLANEVWDTCGLAPAAIGDYAWAYLVGRYANHVYGLVRDVIRWSRADAPKYDVTRQYHGVLTPSGASTAILSAPPLTWTGSDPISPTPHFATHHPITFTTERQIGTPVTWL